MKTKMTLYKISLFVLLLILIVLSYLQIGVHIKVLSGLILIGLIPLLIVFIIIEKIEDKKERQMKDDEFTKLIKYKAGYYAFKISLLIWMLLILFRDKFPQLEREMGNSLTFFGIILSMVIYFISRIVIIRKINEE